MSESQFQSNPLLWDEILLPLFSFLSFKDIQRVRLVCRKWKEVSTPTFRSKGRMILGQVYNKLRREKSVELEVLPNLLLCDYTNHPHHTRDIWVYRHELDIEEISFPFEQQELVTDVSLCVLPKGDCFPECISAPFFRRFVLEVSRGMFKSLTSFSLRFLAIPANDLEEDVYNMRTAFFPRISFTENSLVKLKTLKLYTSSVYENEGYFPELIKSLISAVPNLQQLETDFPILGLAGLKKLTQLHVHLDAKPKVAIENESVIRAVLDMLDSLKDTVKKLSLKGIVFKRGFNLPVFPKVEEVFLDEVWLVEENISRAFPGLKTMSLTRCFKETSETLTHYISNKPYSLRNLEIGKKAFQPQKRLDDWGDFIPLLPSLQSFTFWLYNDGNKILKQDKDAPLKFIANLELSNVAINVWGDTRLSSLIRRLQNFPTQRKTCGGKSTFVLRLDNGGNIEDVNGEESQSWRKEDCEVILEFPNVMQLLASKYDVIKIKNFYVSENNLNIMTKGIAEKQLPVEIFCGLMEDDDNPILNCAKKKKIKNPLSRLIRRVFKRTVN